MLHGEVAAGPNLCGVCFSTGKSHASNLFHFGSRYLGIQLFLKGGPTEEADHSVRSPDLWRSKCLPKEKQPGPSKDVCIRRRVPTRCLSGRYEPLQLRQGWLEGLPSPSRTRSWEGVRWSTPTDKFLYPHNAPSNSPGLLSHCCDTWGRGRISVLGSQQNLPGKRKSKASVGDLQKQGNRQPWKPREQLQGGAGAGR